MKTVLSKLSIIFFVLITIACSKDEDQETIVGEDQGTVTDDVKSYEEQIMNLINEYRVKNNLPKLKVSQEIRTQTEKHTNYMISKGKISHDLWSERVNYINNKFKTTYAAENVAYNQSSNPKTVVNQWINSAGHRKNILGSYTHFYLTAKQSSNGNWYYTNIFVRVP